MTSLLLVNSAQWEADHHRCPQHELHLDQALVAGAAPFHHSWRVPRLPHRFQVHFLYDILFVFC